MALGAHSIVLDELDKSILMELQYRFPDTHTPYIDTASRLGIGVGVLLERLRRLHEAGVLKRVGFYVNYRSQRLRAALLAIAAGPLIDVIANEVFSSDPQTTHVYERNHPVYNLWVVSKRPSLEELHALAGRLEEEYGVDVVVLYGRKTHKLSVKYDLYKGVSRSGPYSLVSQNPPGPEHYGLTPEALRLFRKLPLEQRPYRVIAGRLGIGEDEAVSLAWKMLRDGVLGDPGAALDGHLLGFRINSMITVRERRGRLEETCRCMAGSPYTTHVVERSVYPEGKWDYKCYAMVHAVDRDTADSVVAEVTGGCGIDDYYVLESVRDLKPGTVR